MAGDLVLDEPSFPNYTAAVPGFGRSFGERLMQYEPALHPLDLAAQFGSDLASPQGRELTRAALDATMYSSLISSREQTRAEAAALRIDAIARATGSRLENPYLGGYGVEARRRVREAALNDPDYDPRQGIPGAARAIFDERVAEVARVHADKVAGLGLDTPLEEIGNELATTAEQRLTFAQQGYTASGRGALGALAAQAVGGAAGGSRDPLTIGAWAFGPAGGIGRTVLARVLSEGAVQGAFNLVLSAIEKPAAQSFREERGQPVAPKLLTAAEAGHAVLFGFLGGAAVRGGIELGHSMLRSGERIVAADRDAIAERPAGVDAQAHEIALDQAAAHVNDPVNEPPPALVPQAREPSAGAPDRLAELRAIAARASDPADVVESLRLARELTEAAIASGEPDLVNAAKLASLSDPAWQAVRDGKNPPEHGLITAEQAADPADHAQVLERLAQEAPADAQEARLIAADEVEGQAARREVETLRATSKPKKALPGRVAHEDMSLIQMLISAGGLKPTPDLLHVFGGENPWVRPYGKLFKPTGKSIQDATELLRSEGFLRDPDAGLGSGGASYEQASRDVGFHQLTDALAADPHALRIGRDRVEKLDPVQQAHLREQHRAGLETAFDAGMAEHQIAAPKGLRKRALQIMAEDSAATPLAAYDRAQLEHEARIEEKRRARQGEPIDIPFDGEPAVPPDGRGGSPPAGGAAADLHGRSGGAGTGDVVRADLAGARPDRGEGGDQPGLPGIDAGRVKPAQAELPLAGGEAEAAIRARLKEQLAAPPAAGRGRDQRGALFDQATQHDMMDLVPAQREDGSPVLIAPEEVALVGERQSLFADLARSCQS